MTSTAHPPVPAEPPPRRTAAAGDLWDLRRQIAELRADNDRLRHQLQQVAAFPRPRAAPVPTPRAAGAGPATCFSPATPPAHLGEGGLAGQLATVLAEVLKVDSVALDGHFFTDLGADSLLMAKFCARVRKRPGLPQVSIKDIYRHPTITALAGAFAPAPAVPEGLAVQLAAVLAEVLKVDSVALDGHFFTDLGADSLLMAKFCARVRKRPGLPQVSIKDIYRHPTITALAGAVEAAEPAAGPATQVPWPAPDPATAPMSRSTPHFYLCGLLQLLMFLGSAVLAMFILVNGFLWITAGPTLLEIYLRSVLYTSATFTGACLLSILAKWVLIGRWKPRQIPVWSLDYVRFWLVKTLIRTNPLARFAGTPLFSLYLRALGAKIGRGVVIFSPTVPVCTDLLTIGSGTLIRKDSVITGYRAVNGIIQIGPISLGRDTYIGEMTVLDIGTSMGDGAQLGHSSSLHTGQTIPAGQRWHGSPAEPTNIDYKMVKTTQLSFLRRAVLPLLQLILLLGVTMPLSVSILILVFREVPQLAALVGDLPPVVTTWTFYRDAVLLATVLYFGSLVLGMLAVVTLPRLLRLIVRPDRDYRLYGIQYWANRTMARLTNRSVFMRLYGDSSYIVHYLRAIGYNLSKVVQTGSNFGTGVKHDNPFLSTVGTKTMVADGLSLINADYSSTHFRVSRVSIGEQNFLGNRIAYPAQARTGGDCLLATKVLVPLDGKIRNGVGLLGSPSFEIPRSVDRDQQLWLTDPAELRRKLFAKTRHNTVSILLLLGSRWLLTCLLTVITLATVDLYSEFGIVVAALAGCLLLPLTMAYFLLLDRIMRFLLALRPNGCSIYDRAFWRHERFWKIAADGYTQIFNGTPFKPLLWRMLGVRIGRRVFDDGCGFTERPFVAIGDLCTLNAGSVIQSHSQEDGAFKSDRSAIGPRCTLGVGAFVHYGVRVHANVHLAADSFLMKGSEVPAAAGWGGNPATEISAPGSAPRAAGPAGPAW